MTLITHHVLTLRYFNTAELEVEQRYVTEERKNINNYKIPSLTTAVRHFVLFAKRLGGYQAQCPCSQKYFREGSRRKNIKKENIY